jgi:hypothetical protein
MHGPILLAGTRPKYDRAVDRDELLRLRCFRALDVLHA